jgi:hypothetical protein
MAGGRSSGCGAGTPGRRRDGYRGCCGQLKRTRVASMSWSRAGIRAANIDEYGQAKTGMVQKILAAAGLTAAERASIAGNQVPSHDEPPR